MELKENFELYIKYADGDLDCECKLEIQDKINNDFDFSKYDLNNCAFVGITFKNSKIK